MFYCIFLSVQAHAANVSVGIDLEGWQYNENFASSVNIKGNGYILSPSVSISSEIGNDFVSKLTISGYAPLSKGSATGTVNGFNPSVNANASLYGLAGELSFGKKVEQNIYSVFTKFDSYKLNLNNVYSYGVFYPNLSYKTKAKTIFVGGKSIWRE